MRRLLLLCSICFLTLSAAFAQVDTGTIAGSVRDSQGASVPTATISITAIATGVTTKAQTDSSGEFVSPPLRPGDYKVVAEAQGFKTSTRNLITLKVQDRLRVDFDMAVGSISENIEVTSETPTIQSETSSLGQVITTTQITELPLNGRDYVQLATLSTGVVRTSSGTNGNSGGSSTGGQNSFVANGTRGTLNNFLLDGIDNNSNDNGGFVLRTNVDAIQEFKLQTNSYSAEFGRSGGAVVNAIIKSGSNQLHGGVFEFFRNSALDARDYFELPTDSKASLQAESVWWNSGRRAYQEQTLLVRRLSRNTHSQPIELELQGPNRGGTCWRFFRRRRADRLRSPNWQSVSWKHHPHGPHRPHQPGVHESLPGRQRCRQPLHHFPHGTGRNRSG